MDHSFEGIGTATLVIELLPDSPLDQAPGCRLVFPCGHVEAVDIEPRFARVLRRLVGYRMRDRSEVSRELQGFRMKETISAEITEEWFPLDKFTVRRYAREIRKAVRNAFEQARQKGVDARFVDPVDIDRRYGIRVGEIPIRFIDHSQRPPFNV